MELWYGTLTSLSMAGNNVCDSEFCEWRIVLIFSLLRGCLRLRSEENIGWQCGDQPGLAETDQWEGWNLNCYLSALIDIITCIIKTWLIISILLTWRLPKFLIQLYFIKMWCREHFTSKNLSAEELCFQLFVKLKLDIFWHLMVAQLLLMKSLKIIPWAYIYLIKYLLI